MLKSSHIHKKIFVQELNANRQRFLSKLYLAVMTKKNY